MSRTLRPEQESTKLKLLDKRLLETSPPELRQTLEYVLHLRSYWKPEGRAKLIVPASWMACSAFANSSKREVRCALNQYCPFRNVRFESAPETRPVALDEVPRDVVWQLTNTRINDCLTTFVPRAFEGIPHTRLQRDVPAIIPQSASRRIDFALVPEYPSSMTENAISENNTRCMLFGIKEPTQMQPFHSTSPGSHLTLTSIPEELIRHGQFHLTCLASLAQRGAVKAISKSFPEWLVLFGFLYDTHRVRIVAYVPRHRKPGEIDCAAFIVDELVFDSSITTAAACELVIQRLRLLSALTTLRRHVHHLSKFLFTTIGPCDGIGLIPDGHSLLLDCAMIRDNSDDSRSLKRCASLGSSQHCGSEYSTCPSRVHIHGLSDVSSEERLPSSCSSIFSSICSTRSSLESASSLDSLRSEDSLVPPTHSLSQGDNKSVNYLYKLTETRRWEIRAWAQQVIPTEHPVRDNYRMVILPTVADSTSNTCR